MADLRCEIFVSKDGENYTKLDLLKDESIIIKYLKKDTKDLSKVYAPYSNGFSIGATEKNMIAFGFFGQTEVIRLAGANIFNCKIYVNGFLNNIGLLKIENIKYLKGRASSFNVSFNSNILSLKDRIGDDKIEDLAGVPLEWLPNKMFNAIKSTQVVSGVNYYAPLISNNRVWNYDIDNVDVDQTDNICFKSSNSPKSDKVINFSEIRPAVSLKSLFGLIKNKYNLLINMPLENRIEFLQAYVWCNGSNFGNTSFNLFKLLNNFSNGSYGNASVNFTDSSISLNKDSNVIKITMRVKFYNLISGDEDQKNNVSFKFVNKLTSEEIYSFDFEVEEGYNELIMVLPLFYFVSNNFSFFLYHKFNRPIHYTKSEITFRFVKPLGYTSSSSVNNNNLAVNNSAKIDLLKSIPETKVMDLLTSIIKTFNISIFDSSVNNENLDFLTIQDLENEAAVFGKREVDYTRFSDLEKVDKKVLEDFTYYNFKHKDSKYKSNIDFKNQFGIAYGQATYPAAKPPQAKEYVIDSGFSIIPPVTINGLPVVQTCYGFTDAQPSFDTGAFRYTPNEDELTLFYKSSPLIISSLGCQNINTSGVLINSALTTYQKSTPFNITNGYSLGFSVLVNNSISYPKSLYFNYYKKQTEAFLNPNTLEHSISMELPPQEIYLNENVGMTPLGFRLQNDVIISETKYEIIEAEINIATGKTKAKLLNK